MKWHLLLLPGALLAACLFLTFACTATPPLLDAGDLDGLIIYAYRDWQNAGVVVRTSQLLRVRARGEWLYTPGEWHGPAGHPRFRAPNFYPVPGVNGGALIAKIGENGRPFYVGADLRGPAFADGTLYLRIDDDILSDNEGYVQVEVQVE